MHTFDMYHYPLIQQVSGFENGKRRSADKICTLYLDGQEDKQSEVQTLVKLYVPTFSRGAKYG